MRLCGTPESVVGRFLEYDGDWGDYSAPKGVGTPHLQGNNSAKGPQMSYGCRSPQNLLEHTSDIRDGLSVLDIHQPISSNHQVDSFPCLLVRIREQRHSEEKRFEYGCALKVEESASDYVTFSLGPADHLRYRFRLSPSGSRARIECDYSVPTGAVWVTYLRIARHKYVSRRRSQAFPLIPSCHFGQLPKGPGPEMEGQPHPPKNRCESEREGTLKKKGGTICFSAQLIGQVNSFSTRVLV